MLSDKIKGKSALNARTFLHVRDKVHVQAVYASIDGKPSSPAKVSSYLPFDKIANRNPRYDKMRKTLHWRNFYL